MNRLLSLAPLACVDFLLALQRAALSAACGVLFRRSAPSAPERVLVLRTGGLGDFLFAVPALAVLRRRLPKARIVLLTAISTDAGFVKTVAQYTGSPMNLPWLDFVRPGLVDDVFVLPSGGRDEIMAGLRPKIIALDPDAAFLLSFPGEPFRALAKKLVFLKTLGVRGPVYGWRKKASYAFLRKQQDAAGRFEHKVLGPIRAIEECTAVGSVKESEISFPLRLHPASESNAIRFWAQNRLDQTTVVALAPGSIRPHKQWPIESYAALGRRLLSDPAVTLLVIGSGMDRPLAERLVSELGARCVSSVGPNDLSYSAELLKRCALVVGNDGGGMHLASAVGCRCVTVSNSVEGAGAVEPWFSRDLAVRRSVPCSPCYSETHCPLGEHVCVTGISVEAVYERCVGVLGRTP